MATTDPAPVTLRENGLQVTLADGTAAYFNYCWLRDNCPTSFDRETRQKVIELDDRGDVSGVTISQHMADVFDLPQEQLDRYYPAFRRFGRLLQAEKYVMRCRLNAGECAVFDNHRVVHGREAYAASSGERHLRGCYTDRGELRSAYRVLTSETRFR